MTGPSHGEMLIYHRTHHAEAILRDGYYAVPGIGEVKGIFVSADWPLDENEGADGDRVIVLTIPAELFVEYEHIEEGKTYRESMIPAADLNEHLTTARVLTQDEEDELGSRRCESFRHVTEPRDLEAGS